jgi:hypothetical protein
MSNQVNTRCEERERASIEGVAAPISLVCNSFALKQRNKRRLARLVCTIRCTLSSRIFTLRNEESFTENNNSFVFCFQVGRHNHKTKAKREFTFKIESIAISINEGKRFRVNSLEKSWSKKFETVQRQAEVACCTAIRAASSKLSTATIRSEC